jgi:hypothetical protein
VAKKLMGKPFFMLFGLLLSHIVNFFRTFSGAGGLGQGGKGLDG